MLSTLPVLYQISFLGIIALIGVIAYKVAILDERARDVIEAAMPCMTILVILAKRYGADDKLAMENFFVTTILSIFTLPLILFLLDILKI